MQLIRLSLALPASAAGYLSSIAAALHVSQTPQPVLPFRGMSSIKAAVKAHPFFLEPHAHENENAEEDYVDGPHRALGLSRPLYALIFGILSGLSLPVGALLGIKWAPVKEHHCAAMIAFGAGCLLFAVTVELYAHSLHELKHGNIGNVEMVFQTLGALDGACFYIWMNRWLETTFSEPHAVDPHESSRQEQISDENRVSRIFTKNNYQSILKIKGFKKPLEVELKATEKAQLHWNSLRTAFRMRKLLDFWQSESLDLRGVRGRDLGMRVLANEMSRPTEKEDEAGAAEAKTVALALFLGLLVDGVPEGVLVGFLSAEGHFSPVLIISLLLANFPEALSSASLMVSAGMSTSMIVGMWSGLCVLVGSLSGLSCWVLLAFYPSFGLNGVELPRAVLVCISLVEGITGGAMMACISSVMLPEAFERTKKDGPLVLSSGFLCTVGFLVSTVMKALGG